jgi:hypothetical protein
VRRPRTGSLSRAALVAAEVSWAMRPATSPGRRGSVRAAVASLALAACGAQPAAPAASCGADRVVLASQADVARLAPCATVRSVAIRTGAALDLSGLRTLATITGDLVIGPTVAMADVSLRGLRRVGGTIRIVSNGLMQGVFLSSLERAGRIDIEGNVALTTISLPRLEAVDGAVHIIDNASLELVNVSALSTIAADLVLAGAPKLVLVDAPELRRAASVRIEAPALPPEVAARLRAVAAP